MRDLSQIAIRRLAALASLMLLAGCQPADPAPASPPSVSRREPGQLYLNQAQPKLDTLKLWIGTQEVETEIARRPTEIATGMMHRTNMVDGTGMLFVFARPEPRSFYMRNTLVPLSIAYLDPDGEILEIHDMKAQDETPVDSASDRIQYALEVPQGWFGKVGIKPGMLVGTSKGKLPVINWATLQPRR
ncbi:MAG: DUF192 domain-containing protein [Verrucomicrobiales bacterium]|nr:DUF192 domain-containing protein [Verrucomicrobiales bacterium]